MEVTRGERLAAWIAAAVLIGLLIMDIDIITGGRLLGRGPSVSADGGLEANDDDGTGDGRV